MKEQIKEFRIKLDGLAQLTKELTVGKKLVIDMATLPNKGDQFKPLKDNGEQTFGVICEDGLMQYKVKLEKTEL